MQSNNQPSKEPVSCIVRVYSCKCVPDAALARLRLRCKVRQRTRARLSHVPVNRIDHEYCLLPIGMSQRAPKIPRKAAGSGQRRDAVAGHAGAQSGTLSDQEVDRLRAVWKKYGDRPDFRNVCLETARWFGACRAREDPDKAEQLRKRLPPLLPAIEAEIAKFEREVASEMAPAFTQEERLLAHLQKAAKPGRWSRVKCCHLCGSKSLLLRWRQAKGAPTFYYSRTGATQGQIGIQVCQDCDTRHDLQCFTPGKRWLERRGSTLSEEEKVEACALAGRCRCMPVGGRKQLRPMHCAMLVHAASCNALQLRGSVSKPFARMQRVHACRLTMRSKTTSGFSLAMRQSGHST